MRTRAGARTEHAAMKKDFSPLSSHPYQIKRLDILSGLFIWVHILLKV